MEDTTNNQQPQQPAKTLPEASKKQLLTSLLEEKKKKNPDSNMLKYFEELVKPHQYWDKCPTLREGAEQQPGSQLLNHDIKAVPKDPFPLPKEELAWSDLNILDDAQLDEFYELMNLNYAEDANNIFRFDYSRQFLRWALTPPGYRPDWLIGVRNGKKELVATIMGIPVTVAVEGEKKKMAQINFLCIHKQYRSLKLTPILIEEVSRRIKLRDKWLAIYTAGRTLPTPFARADYFHRPLEPKKLIECQYHSLSANQTVAMVKKIYSLPEQPTMKLRPMNKADIFGVTKLLNDALSKCVVYMTFTEEEVKHYFMPRENVMHTFVASRIEATVSGKKKEVITDLISYYDLPIQVFSHPKHSSIRTCYSFYSVATTVTYKELTNNALILAKKKKYDLFSCLNLMENRAEALQELLFKPADNCLNYYLFNWVMKCHKITPDQLGVIMF